MDKIFKISGIVICDIFYILTLIGIYIPEMISAKDNYYFWTGLFFLIVMTPILAILSYYGIKKALKEN